MYLAELLPEQRAPAKYGRQGEEEFFFLSWTQSGPSVGGSVVVEASGCCRDTFAK